MTPGARTNLMSALVVLLAGLNAMGQKTLQGTYVDQATTTSTAIPAGTMVAIGNPITVTCTPSFKTGCTLVADMWATIGRKRFGQSIRTLPACRWVRAHPCRYGYQGITPSDGTWVMATSSQSTSGLASGSRTVQAFFWSRKWVHRGDAPLQLHDVQPVDLLA